MSLDVLFWLLLRVKPVYARKENLSATVFCKAVPGCRFYGPQYATLLE